MLPATPLRGLPMPATSRRWVGEGRDFTTRQPLSATAILLGCRTATHCHRDREQREQWERLERHRAGAQERKQEEGEESVMRRSRSAAAEAAAAAAAAATAADTAAAAAGAATSLEPERPRRRLSRDFELEDLGLPIDLLLGGAPAAIGALWDVLGGDLERFALILLQQWCSSEGPHPDTKFFHALQAARAGCELKTLTAAAVVCYGIPPHLI
mmetsp:Transcript_66897/g.139668  ORF Transcript_66897/g.139668 Transcript_66897/m.139668 type:complete len:213 (+) Transcript_66897:1-639(+)